MTRGAPFLALAAALAAGCTATTGEVASRGAALGTTLPSLSEVGGTPAPDPDPSEADPALCWAEDIAPAVIETEARTVAVTGPRGGERFRTETVQRIARERQELRIEVPCPAAMDEVMIASLQRALKARGLYGAPVTGAMDAATEAAIRRWQAPRGLDSAIVSMATARQFGLARIVRTDVR